MKLLKQLIVVSLVAVCLELGIFNFSAIKMRLSSNSLKNQSYTLADCTQINWVQDGSDLISQPDPQLILELHGGIEQIKLSYETEGSLPYIDLFYTNSIITAFSGDAALRVETPDSVESTVLLNWDVSALRIDFGDEPGLRLKELNLVVNPTEIEISMARIVTIYLLFFVSKFLFSLQRTPEYGLETEKKST